MRLPNRLSELRGDRSISQVAREASVPRAYLSQIEKGAMVPRDVWLEGLERAYGVSRSEFYETWALGNGGRMLVELAEDGES